MDLPVNQFKKAIKAGKPQIGIWSSMCSAISAEVLADAGFDWVLLDTEHSPNELPIVQNQLDALLAGTTTEGIVRPAWNDTVLIKRYLDVGARTLLLPYVQNVEEARRAVAATRYPPQGVRGVSGCTRANRYGRVKDYFKRVHDETCVLVQVETQAAMKQIEAIAAVDAVREHKRVVQVGTQWRSDGKFIACANAAQSGELGKVTRISISQNFEIPQNFLFSPV